MHPTAPTTKNADTNVALCRILFGLASTNTATSYYVILSRPLLQNRDTQREGGPGSRSLDGALQRRHEPKHCDGTAQAQDGPCPGYLPLRLALHLLAPKEEEGGQDEADEG